MANDFIKPHEELAHCHNSAIEVGPPDIFHGQVQCESRQMASCSGFRLELRPALTGSDPIKRKFALQAGSDLFFCVPLMQFLLEELDCLLLTPLSPSVALDQDKKKHCL